MAVAPPAPVRPAWAIFDRGNGACTHGSRCFLMMTTRSKEEIQATAAATESLVPIRLELDIGNYRLRDSFLWNLNGEQREGNNRYH